MPTSREIRAARAFLNWSREKLADETGLALNTIVRLENEDVDSKSSTVKDVRERLQAEGFQFLSLSEDGVEGIRFRKPKLVRVPLIKKKN